MAVRWHVFNFTQPIACDKQKDVPPGSKCFAALIQLGSQLKIYTLYTLYTYIQELKMYISNCSVNMIVPKTKD